MQLGGRIWEIHPHGLFLSAFLPRWIWQGFPGVEPVAGARESGPRFVGRRFAGVLSAVPLVPQKQRCLPALQLGETALGVSRRSWRVSAMGLLSIGRGEGPQVIQFYAVGMNEDRSRLGCCSARPRAEHRCEGTHQTVNGFTCVEWPARARPTAPAAGALPNAIALFPAEGPQTTVSAKRPRFAEGAGK